MENINTGSRVLIVDDMRVNCMILSSMLYSHGVSSDMAESGRECIELFKKNHYDLILMDHRMPDIDGVDTFVQLKSLFEENGREVPVVCHTTEAGRENINLYKAAGFAEVLIKPIDPKELLRILMTYLPGANTDRDRENEALEKKHVEEELAKLPESIQNIEGLDPAVGIVSSDTAEDYLDVLRIFAGSIMTKAAEIEDYFNKGDYDNFTIKVHSVSSMSRIAGAVGLSDEAALLENAGKERDIDYIQEKTPVFLTHYREYHDRLKNANL